MKLSKLCGNDAKDIAFLGRQQMLKLCHIKKSFKSKEVLKDVSFSVREGEIVCLLGNNGAGKTTIINCILRMIKTDEGSIFLDDKNIREYKNAEYFSKVNALLESSVNIYDYLTGRQNIDYFAGLMNMDKKDPKIQKYISLFELQEHIDKPAGEYSRGMQQKLALVIALMSSPQLLLLDEPTLGLDIKSKLSVIHILNEIIREEKIGVILTTHQMDVVQKLNSRILILKDGVVSEFDEKKYENDTTYSVSYLKDGLVVKEDVDGSFREIFDRYHSETEIIEIRKKEKDIEEIMAEVLDESDQGRI